MTNTDTANSKEDSALLDLVEATEPVREAEAEERQAKPAPADAPPIAMGAQPKSPEQPPTKAANGGGFFPALLGGVLAAIGGFALSHYNVLKLSDNSASVAGIEEKLNQQASDTAALKSDLQSLREQPAVTPSVDGATLDRLTKIEAALANQEDSQLSGQIEELKTRVAALESLPTTGSGASPAALAALQSQIDSLKQSGASVSGDLTAMVNEAEKSLADAMAEALALKEDAQSLAGNLRALAALDRIEASVDTGNPFETALKDLEGYAVPPELAGLAATGIPTLARLQSTFPESARSALTIALQENMGETWSERVASFLRNQTGARSLEPREGTDPDAVLSRAEAALAKADLTTALQEISGLSALAQSAMADWTALANQRLQAQQSVGLLAKALGTKGATE